MSPPLQAARHTTRQHEETVEVDDNSGSKQIQFNTWPKGIETQREAVIVNKNETEFCDLLLPTSRYIMWNANDATKTVTTRALEHDIFRGGANQVNRPIDEF